VVTILLVTPLTSKTNGKSQFIPLKFSSYKMLAGLVRLGFLKTDAKRPRKKYIPGWNEISENLYQEYIDGNVEVAMIF